MNSFFILLRRVTLLGYLNVKVTLNVKTKSKRRACLSESLHFFHSTSMDLIQDTASLYRSSPSLIKLTYFQGKLSTFPNVGFYEVMCPMTV